MIEFLHKSGDENIFGQIFANEKEAIKSIVLHGGGLKTDHKRLKEFATSLEQINLNPIIFDFSGHGNSTNNSPNSLEKRVNESLSIIDFYFFNKPVIIFAFSMSGHVALKLLEYKRIIVEKLVLFCPAIYSKDSFKVNFGPEFTQIIRSENSWLNTDVLNTVESYNGKLQIFYGLMDNIVPRGVIDLIYNNANSAKAKELNLVQDCGHTFLDYMNSKSTRDIIIDKIKRFCCE